MNPGSNIRLFVFSRVGSDIAINWEKLYLFAHERYIYICVCVGNSFDFVGCESKSIRTRVSSFFEIILNL